MRGGEAGLLPRGDGTVKVNHLGRSLVILQVLNTPSAINHPLLTSGTDTVACLGDEA
jgi:hypothetical protein